MTPQEVETVMEIFHRCYLGGGCALCPLNKDDIEGDCAIMSGNMVMDALKRLKFLETPTEVEQPKLPFEKEENNWFERKRKLWRPGYKLSRKRSYLINPEMLKLFEEYSKQDTEEFDANLYGRALNVLSANHIYTVDDLLRLSSGDIERMRNVGPIISDFIEFVQIFARNLRSL